MACTKKRNRINIGSRKAFVWEKGKKKSNILPEAALEYVTRQFISDYRERVSG